VTTRNDPTITHFDGPHTLKEQVVDEYGGTRMASEESILTCRPTMPTVNL
jgi:hypothetical protein